MLDGIDLPTSHPLGVRLENMPPGNCPFPTDIPEDERLTPHRSHPSITKQLSESGLGRTQLIGIQQGDTGTDFRGPHVKLDRLSMLEE